MILLANNFYYETFKTNLLSNVHVFNWLLVVFAILVDCLFVYQLQNK